MVVFYTLPTVTKHALGGQKSLAQLAPIPPMWPENWGHHNYRNELPQHSGSYYAEWLRISGTQIILDYKRPKRIGVVCPLWTSNIRLDLWNAFEGAFKLGQALLQHCDLSSLGCSPRNETQFTKLCLGCLCRDKIYWKCETNCKREKRKRMKTECLIVSARWPCIPHAHPMPNSRGAFWFPLPRW